MKHKNRLLELRGKMSQKKFAAPLGLTQQNYGNYERGKQKLNADLIVRICETYGCTAEWLLGLDNRPANAIRVAHDDSSFVDVPLYGSTAAGTPIEMVESEGPFPIPRAKHEEFPKAFLLRVTGESMNRILPNGCYALVDPCDDVERDNQPYAVCVNGYDATVKRVHKLNNGFELVPDSTDPTFKPQVFDYGIEGTETITPIGRVVYYVLPYDWRF